MVSQMAQVIRVRGDSVLWAKASFSLGSQPARSIIMSVSEKRGVLAVCFMIVSFGKVCVMRRLTSPCPLCRAATNDGFLLHAQRKFVYDPV